MFGMFGKSFPKSINFESYIKHCLTLIQTGELSSICSIECSPTNNNNNKKETHTLLWNQNN